MPSTRRLAAIAAAAASLTAAAPATAFEDDTAGQRAFAVSSTQQLYSFRLGATLSTVRPQGITGLPARAAIVGIDERPLTGQLYAVVRSTSTSAASVYTIDPATAQATPAFTLVKAGTSTPVVLDGTVGVDFNPMADALRIVTSTGQNLRALPSARVVGGVFRVAGETFTDGGLNYNGTPALGITEAAYSSNVPAATSTFLYDIDTTNRTIAFQNPPNSGSLQTLFTPPLLNNRNVQGFDFGPGTPGTPYLVLGNVRQGDARVSRIYDISDPNDPQTVGTFGTNDILDFATDLP